MTALRRIRDVAQVAVAMSRSSTATILSSGLLAVDHPQPRSAARGGRSWRAPSYFS